MKKFVNFMAIVGLVAVIWLIYAVFNYGRINHLRIEAQASAWRWTHAYVDHR